MKKIYTAPNPAEAHLVRGLLESYGIHSEVRGESLFSVRGELPMFGETSPTVWVLLEKDVPEAIKIIQEYEANDAESNSEQVWECSCGEVHQVQFTACWNCGKEMHFIK